MVLFSIERVIAVYFPIKRFSICNKNRNKLFVALIAIIALVLYSYSLISSELEVYEGKTLCITLKKWFDLVNFMAFLDTIVTMIVPFFIIFFSNVLIVVKLMQFKNPCHRNFNLDDIIENDLSTNIEQTNSIDISPHKRANYLVIYNLS